MEVETKKGIPEEKLRELVEFYFLVKEMEKRGSCLNPLEIEAELERITGEKPPTRFSTFYGVGSYIRDKYGLKLE